MKNYILTAIRLTAITIILFGVLYPLLITGIASVAAPGNGDGETIKLDGREVGFTLIGQQFGQDKYFHGRPSAVAYNAAATGGSNKGPSNAAYLADVQSRIDEILQANPGISENAIPVDLITASGSGIDPHISPQAARIQIDRIARARNMDKQRLEALVKAHTEAPLWGLFGTSRVNVLCLNIALDESRNR
ncbi:MAG: potassium-transporting ATPase subunit KdpC [Bacteroidia bacterium]|nr:potassium-transporting ATPase subunit KdpC [Bacteroidia bacterium]